MIASFRSLDQVFRSFDHIASTGALLVHTYRIAITTTNERRKRTLSRGDYNDLLGCVASLGPHAFVI